MSYQKQPELNGAYYGPPIPPPARQSNRPGRRGPNPCCCLFDCLCDCGCCLLSCFFKIIFSIIITIGIIVLIVWLIIRPHALKFHATDATLTTFNLTTSPSGATLLSYNLAVNFTVRNPNRRIGVYYDGIETNAIYDGQRLSTVQALDNTIYQGHKNTTSFGPLVFKGQNQAVSLDSDDKDNYQKQSNNDGGIYEIEVKMYLRVRFKVGVFKFGTYKPKVKCNLDVPLQGKSSQTFQETRCHYST